MISFTGVVTYKNATEVVAAARLVPLDRIMVETDAPYLSPEPVRKTRPNEPKYVVHTASHLAAIFNLSVSEFERQTDQNAIKFFRLPI
jgi:TatD DNase family protein